jgi:hypothetical protein
MPWGSKLVVNLAHSYILSHHPGSLPTSFTAPEKGKRDRKWRERKRRKIGENTQILKVVPSLPP